MESNDVWDGSYPVVFNEVVCYDEDMLAVVICDADLLPGKIFRSFTQIQFMR